MSIQTVSSLLSLPEHVLLYLLDVSFEDPQPFCTTSLHPTLHTFAMWACPKNDFVFTLSAVCKVFRDLTLPLRFRVISCPTYDVWLRFLRLVDESPTIAHHVRYLAASLMRSTTPSPVGTLRSTVVPFSISNSRPVVLPNLMSFQILSQSTLNADFTSFLLGSPGIRDLSVVGLNIQEPSSTLLHLKLVSLSIHLLGSDFTGLMSFLHSVVRDSGKCTSRLQNLQVILSSSSMSRTPTKVSSLFPEDVEFPELRAFIVGGTGFSKDEDSFPELSGRFPSLRCLVVKTPRGKALDPLSVGHWENIQRLHIQYSYDREDEELKEGILRRVHGVRELFISGVSLVSFGSMCRTVGSLGATAITTFSLRFSFVSSIANFDFTSLDVAIPSLPNLEILTVIGEPKLPVRTPLWSCDLADLAAKLSRESINCATNL